VAEKQKVSFNITQKCIKYLSNGKYYAKCWAWNSHKTFTISLLLKLVFQWGRKATSQIFQTLSYFRDLSSKAPDNKLHEATDFWCFCFVLGIYPTDYSTMPQVRLLVYSRY
jgi:hypothetical protein